MCWRSGAPCTCSSRVSEELREKFRSLRMDFRHVEEITYTRLKDFQRENQGLRDDITNLQGQLHQKELKNNEYLAIYLHGINRNIVHIGEMVQQMGNPLNRPHDPMNSNDSAGSRLPSTFHSATSNEHPLVPLASLMAPAWSNPGEGNQQP